MPARYDEHTGTRIAAYRKLRGLTQTGLAHAANVSYSLLSKVESGHRPASPGLTSACARAMRVNVFDLTGQPYIGDLQRDHVDELIQPIRGALENWDLPLDWPMPPRPLEEIRAEVQRALIQRRDAQYASMAQTLPDLIDELVHASQVLTGADTRAAHTLLADLYRCVHTLAYKLCLIDLGTVALERMAWSAERSDDPFLGALKNYLRAQSTYTTGRLEVGLRVVETTHAQLRRAPNDPRRDALAGALHLQGAVMAARTHLLNASGEHLDAARSLAADTGELGAYGLSFGPTNVATHAVGVALDIEQPRLAIARAQEVHMPADWSRSRAGHYWIDLARAHTWVGEHERALTCLMEARSVAPQQARYSSSVRETVGALVRQKRALPSTIANYAAWIGM